MDIKKYIIPSRLDNPDDDYAYGDPHFETLDQIYIESELENKKRTKLNEDRLCFPTDYAILNGCTQSYAIVNLRNRTTCGVFLRSHNQFSSFDTIGIEGDIETELPATQTMGIVPFLKLDLEIVKKLMSENFFKLGKATLRHNSYDYGSIYRYATTYHTLEFGYYPQTYVGDELNKILQTAPLVETGKTYLGHTILSNTFAHNKEYVYQGKKYVQVDVRDIGDNKELSTGDEIMDRKKLWVSVDPIVWEIRNWEHLPTYINPNGDGSAKYIELKSDCAIIGGLPMNSTSTDFNKLFWQNSLIRAYLNDINVANIQHNGNPNFATKTGANFSSGGFISEALEPYIKEAIAQTIQTPLGNQNNPYGFEYIALDNDQMLLQYIKAGIPLFLHGPSGVGKSDRIKALDPTATRITLRPQMNPEEVDGVLNRETGEYIPPLWYTQLCEKCAREPNRKHILFIDELTNVKPTIQSLVYSIVLERAGKDGLWPLPDNAVVVAAGNESSDTQVAHPLPAPLFRRFSHLYFKVDAKKWLEWAMGISQSKKVEHVEKNHHPKIHPAIVAYIMSRNVNILNQDLDEENPQIVTDPRKWEIASKVLYATKNPYALAPAIGETLCQDFAIFAKSTHISVQDVLSGNFQEETIRSFNTSEKYACILGLLNANKDEQPIVRKFVEKHLGKEFVSTFDTLLAHEQTSNER